MTEAYEDVRQAIVEAKRELRAGMASVGKVFAEVSERVADEVAEIGRLQASGQQVIPEIPFDAIASGAVGDATKDLVRRRGAVIVKDVFPPAQVEAWDAELADYLIRNGYYEREKDADLDKYFTTIQSQKPQIFGIYWSPPQVQARQSPSLAVTRAWLNRLWRWQTDGTRHFDPDRECVYADRIRRREPGDATIGLAPHMDAGSVERWLDPGYRNVYRNVFSGDWRAFDMFDGAFRNDVIEIESPAVCRAFRTYQGWTALTRQGRGDGTLQLVPVANAIVYILLRPLLDDVAPDDLCGAAPGRSLAIVDEFHAPLLRALVTIPEVQPGDTVWWHPDVIHGVEDRHQGRGYSNVMYIGAAPDCPKNRRHLELQKPRFLEGRSAPDFAAEDYEVDYVGRATLEDLTPLGRAQMGFEAR
ncbi:MAG: YbiU family protein [Alphaproteobacteria bacterium]